MGKSAKKADKLPTVKVVNRYLDWNAVTDDMTIEELRAQLRKAGYSYFRL